MGGLWVEGISPGGSGEGVRHVHLPGVTGDLCQSWKHPSALLDPGSPLSGVLKMEKIHQNNNKNHQKTQPHQKKPPQSKRLDL